MDDRDNTTGIDYRDVSNRLTLDTDTAIIQRSQEIDNRFLDRLADARLDSSSAKAGEFHHVCSIPAVVVEKWMAEGFNIFDKNITAQDILKKLRDLDMDRLVATSKNI